MRSYEEMVESETGPQPTRNSSHDSRLGDWVCGRYMLSGYMGMVNH